MSGIKKFPSPPLAFIFDFDGTLTKHDTMTALCNHVGYAKNSDKNLPPWSKFYEDYMDHKNAFDKMYGEGQPKAGLDGVIEYQRRLRSVEESSFDRVMVSGLFDNVTIEDVKKGAWMATESGDVELRNGVEHLLGAIDILESGFSGEVVRPAIISVDWSANWIREVLKTSEQLARVQMTVDANELPSLGGQFPNMTTSDQKLQGMRDHLKGMGNVMSVYIGDSMTDIECLLDAKLGVCIRDEPMTNGQKQLAVTLGAAKGEIVHISTRTIYTEHSVVWARDLLEVLYWMHQYIGHGMSIGKVEGRKIVYDG